MVYIRMSNREDLNYEYVDVNKGIQRSYTKVIIDQGIGTKPSPQLVALFQLAFF